MKVNHSLVARIEEYIDKGYKVVLMPYVNQAWVLKDDKIEVSFNELDPGTALYLINVHFTITYVDGGTFVLELQKEE